jgi:hypothetical protein
MCTSIHDSWPRLYSDPNLASTHLDLPKTHMIVLAFTLTARKFQLLFGSFNCVAPFVIQRLSTTLFQSEHPRYLRILLNFKASVVYQAGTALLCLDHTLPKSRAA